MADLVNQSSSQPTRKMFMGAVAAVATAGLQHAAINLAGDISWLTWLNSEAVVSALPIIAFFGVGYMMREKG